MNSIRNYYFYLLSLTFLCFFSSLSDASDVSIPNTFQSGTAAVASEVNANFSAVKLAVDDNHTNIIANEQRIAALEAAITNLQTLVNDQAAIIASLQNEVSGHTSNLINLDSTVSALVNSNVLALDPYLTVDTASDPRGPLVTLSGVNFQVVSGIGFTLPDPVLLANGLGNIIIGYDESGPAFFEMCSFGDHQTQQDCEDNGFIWADQHKSGSHNLIVGPYNNYSQSGGIIVGRFNSSTNVNASTIGGHGNIASGRESVIAGGTRNITVGSSSVILGGQQNNAVGPFATASGGLSNTATGFYSSVTGGNENESVGNYSVVSGGFQHKTLNTFNWTGGQFSSAN